MDLFAFANPVAYVLGWFVTLFLMACGLASICIGQDVLNWMTSRRDHEANERISVYGFIAVTLAIGLLAAIVRGCQG